MSEAKAAQAFAADPAGSAWVAANAGSGKTRVLTERVARLLLAGARPEKILCLTYTKTAAAEMQNRLFAMLGAWAMLEDAPLRAALSDLAGDPIEAGTPPLDEAALIAARRLFAEALETPGGLKIQTIHAFCDSLLRRFPLEAGAPPGFRVMDDREKAALIDEILEDMAAEDGPPRDALAAIAARLNEDGVRDMAAAIIADRALFRETVDEGEICAAFGLETAVDAETAQVAATARIDRRALAAMISAWAAGAPTDVAKSERLQGAVADDAALANALIDACLTRKGEPAKRQATDGAKKAEPNWEALTDHLVEVALAAREAGLAADAAAAAIDLARFGAEAIARYEASKAARVRLDFDDLVQRTRDLLTRSEARDWVLYRLDGGVDHLLVDEAQDTSPAQWDVIDAISQEFHAGEGARDLARTSFVVGDEKQSIYSFQGAAPGLFEDMRGRFAAALAPHGGLREAELSFSFRSAPAILRLVDAVFAGDRAAGLTARDAATRHRAFHGARAGRVEIWPPVEPAAKGDAPEPWAPVDMPGPDDPRARLVEIVADRVAAMVAGERLPGGGRRIRPGDILILLRMRAPMMRPLINGLKARGVPVAGADRLALLEELAVKDMLALMRFAVAPEDDLTLAALLRSPLCGITETELFELAHGRKGSLWSALLAAAARWPDMVERLVAARRDADFLRPYEFLERALTADHGRGRRAFLARLGREAEDPLDELLAQALIYETEAAPSFEGFLAWMRADAATVKREQEGARGEVRVMSVHGAKGLEAPVVILPDTFRPVDDDRREKIVAVEGRGGSLAAWKMDKTAEPRALAAERARRRAAAEGEHKRLLYVAMTRAEDLLIVAGAGDPEKAEGTWYGLVEAGAEATAHRRETARADGPETTVIEDDGAAKSEADDAAPAPAIAVARSWLDTDVAPGPPPLLTRAASDLVDFEPQAGGRFPRAVARMRGEAIHAALEVAPDEAAMRRAVFAHPLAPQIAEEAFGEALRAAATLDAASMLDGEALVEAAVSVEIGDVRVMGRIDRLIVAPERIRVIDFKSDDAPPATADAAPAGHLAQLGAYCAAMRGVYPDRPVEAYILWTAAPRLDQLSPAAMTAALSAAKLSPKGEDELV